MHDQRILRSWNPIKYIKKSPPPRLNVWINALGLLGAVFYHEQGTYVPSSWFLVFIPHRGSSVKIPPLTPPLLSFHSRCSFPAWFFVSAFLWSRVLFRDSSSKNRWTNLVSNGPTSPFEPPNRGSFYCYVPLARGRGASTSVCDYRLVYRQKFILLRVRVDSWTLLNSTCLEKRIGEERWWSHLAVSSDLWVERVTIIQRVGGVLWPARFSISIYRRFCVRPNHRSFEDFWTV